LKPDKTFLKPDQMFLILNKLATGHTKESIAAELNISRTTLWRKLQEPEFKKTYNDFFESAYQNLKSTFINIQRQAYKYLSDRLNNGKTPKTTKDRIALNLIKAGSIIFKESEYD
jgi:hypothetical protein